jgi:hypothetical protein
VNVIMLIFFFQGTFGYPPHEIPYTGASDGPFLSRAVCMREGERLMSFDHRVSGFVCK